MASWEQHGVWPSRERIPRKMKIRESNLACHQEIMSPGCDVVIHGLERCKHLNGLDATISRCLQGSLFCVEFTHEARMEWALRLQDKKYQEELRAKDALIEKQQHEMQRKELELNKLKGEFEALDQDFHTRGRRMDEALELMRLAWTTDPTTYRGDFFTLEEFKIQPKPVGSIPIWIGGTSDAAIARASRADGYQGISISPDEMAALVDRLREAGAGDDFVVSYRTGWDPNGMDHRQIVDEAEAYAEAGVHHVVAAPWRRTAEEWIDSMERLVELVPLD